MDTDPKYLILNRGRRAQRHGSSSQLFPERRGPGGLVQARASNWAKSRTGVVGEAHRKGFSGGFGRTQQSCHHRPPPPPPPPHPHHHHHHARHALAHSLPPLNHRAPIRPRWLGALALLRLAARSAYAPVPWRQHMLGCINLQLHTRLSIAKGTVPTTTAFGSSCATSRNS